MSDQSKYYTLYRFSDGTSYKVEIGKDGVTEADMRHLRRVIKSQDKTDAKTEKLETVSIEATIFDDDENPALIDNSADIELIIETADEYDSLHNAIEKLLPQQQALIQKVFFEGISQREMAKRLDISEMAVRKRLKTIFTCIKNNL